MPLCDRCASPCPDDIVSTLYCAFCGWHLCKTCRRSSCCGHSPPIVEAACLRFANRVEYKLERVGEICRVTVLCERTGKPLRELTPKPSRHLRRFSSIFHWGKEGTSSDWLGVFSGSSYQLAFTILQDFFADDGHAAALMDHFIQDVLAPIPPGGSLITREDFRLWAERYTVPLEYYASKVKGYRRT